MKRYLRILVLLTSCLLATSMSWAQCPGTQPFGLGGDTTVCVNGSLILTPGPNFATYLWQDGTTDEFLTVVDSGTYFVQTFDTNGCDYYDTIFVGLAFPTDVVMSPGDSSIICANDSAYFTITNAGSFFSFLWNDGATTSDHWFTAPGLYSAIGINGSGCADTVDILLFPANSPVLDLSSPVYFCPGDSVMVDATDPGFVFYNWAHGPTTPSIYLSTAGFYGLEVQDTNGCLIRDTLSAMPYTLPIVSIFGGGSFCVDTTIVLDPGAGWLNYSWSNGATTSTITVITSGSYFVQVTDSNGCQITSNTSNIIFNTLPASFTPELVNDQLEAPVVAGYTYQWFENGTLIPGATGSVLGNLVEGNTYTVLVTTNQGCQLLSNEYLYQGNLDDTPEGISPNGDGINDQFEIPGLAPYPNNRLVIYNRYGTEIFVAEPYLQNWNGKGPSGDDLPDGTYFYLLDLGDGSEPRNGFIMINR
jgi:gliding motility-associated-like protein